MCKIFHTLHQYHFILYTCDSCVHHSISTHNWNGLRLFPWIGAETIVMMYQLILATVVFTMYMYLVIATEYQLDLNGSAIHVHITLSDCNSYLILNIQWMCTCTYQSLIKSLIYCSNGANPSFNMVYWSHPFSAATVTPGMSITVTLYMDFITNLSPELDIFFIRENDRRMYEEVLVLHLHLSSLQLESRSGL